MCNISWYVEGIINASSIEKVIIKLFVRLVVVWTFFIFMKQTCFLRASAYTVELAHKCIHGSVINQYRRPW